MALFKKRSDPQPAAPTWSPTVNLETARPTVFALAKAPASSDVEVRSAIADFVRRSEKPSLERALDQIRTDPDCLHRPWIWLAAVMRDASAAGDDHLAAAALFWACYWTYTLVPRNNLGAFMELELDPIPTRWKKEILALGVASAERLPPDFVIIGDETGSIQAGPVAATAAAQLGV